MMMMKINVKNLIYVIASIASVCILYNLLIVYHSDLEYEEFGEDSNDESAFVMGDFTPHYVRNKETMGEYEKSMPADYFINKKITAPMIIWWTPFTLDKGHHKKCGASQKVCFFTNARKFRANPQTNRAYIFYGTDFYLHDLPLPREENEEWALVHEESPKNNYLFSFKRIMELFNHTATFKRKSDLTLITQYLSSIEDIESTKFLVSTTNKNKFQEEEGLAPIAYIQSDCNCPSDRDVYVKELMKHVKVDSYGSCLHNKNLPLKYTVNKRVVYKFLQKV